MDWFRGLILNGLVIAAIVLMAQGFWNAESAIQQTAYFAAAAVCAIFARIVQAGRQHKQMMDR